MQGLCTVLIALVLSACSVAAVAIRSLDGRVYATHDETLRVCDPGVTTCANSALAITPVSAAATDTNVYFVDGSEMLYVCDDSGQSCTTQKLPFEASSVAVSSTTQQVVATSIDGQVSLCNPTCSPAKGPKP